VPVRVRYLRFPKLSAKLGGKGSILDEFPDETEVIYDENYMTLDFVINWAADHTDFKHFGGGVVLCFIHAVIDTDTVADNDELQKSGRSNWCGTPLFSQEVTSSVRDWFIGTMLLAANR
jgi:hypothetical protein